MQKGHAGMTAPKNLQIARDCTLCEENDNTSTLAWGINTCHETWSHLAEHRLDAVFEWL